MLVLVLFKPELALRKDREVVRKIFEGFYGSPVKSFYVKPSITQASQHYIEHEGKPFFGKLVRHLTSGVCWVGIYNGSVETARKQLGSGIVDVTQDSLRGKFGFKNGMNGIHVSDSHSAAVRESMIWQDADIDEPEAIDVTPDQMRKMTFGRLAELWGEAFAKVSLE